MEVIFLECFPSVLIGEGQTKWNLKDLLFAFVFVVRYAAAEADCMTALELDHTYMMAYLRRGTARLKLGKPQLARQGVGMLSKS